VPHEVIVETAKARKADLIVMATHGRSGLTHLLMGSVTEKVVRSATCPVLTVRADAAKKRPASRRKKKAT
jgi:nucleotide-binding universal stress UspA family protein